MPNDIIEAWNNHAGNTADVNLILINFLEKVKIPCFPLLVSTRENGLISKDFPTFSQMNGMDVVAMKDSVTFYLLDASIKFQSIDNPPVNILNREALLLGSLFSDWVLVSDERPLLKQHITLFCELKESGLIEGQASLQHYNYAKSYMLDSTLRDEEKNNKKSFDKKPDGLTILSVRQEIPEDDNEPLNENISFTYQPQQTENFYFLNPQFLTPQKANPFTSETRKSDIDLICNQQVILSINLAIPESFDVDHVPKNIIVRAPDSSFYYRRSFSVTTDNIQFTQIFETKKSIFSREDYEGVKEFFSRMYALMNEDIIIKRKK